MAILITALTVIFIYFSLFRKKNAIFTALTVKIMLNQPELGSYIRSHRKHSGLTQAKLAEMIGVGKTVIYDLEKGKETVQLSTLIKILDGLNIKVRLESPLDKTL